LSSDQLRIFIDKTAERAGLAQAQWLKNWLSAKLIELYMEPLVSSRKGQSKHAPAPLNRHKLFFSAFLAFFPKVSQQAFADTFGLSVGAVRNWKLRYWKQRLVPKVEELRREFVECFTGEIRKAPTYVELHALAVESISYPSEIEALLFEQCDKIVSSKREDLTLFFKTLAFLSFQIALLQDAGSAGSLEKGIRELRKHMRQWIFESVRGCIKQGNAEDALALLDALENQWSVEIDRDFDAAKVSWWDEERRAWAPPKDGSEPG
jgi:hypothetical protein